jgi:hypothetical protein
LSASALVAAVGAGVVQPGATTVTLPYFDTAAIDTSSTTVGFADSNLYAETPADINRSLDAMQAMGVNNVRVLLPWAFMEPLPGVDNWATADYIVNAANQRGMGVLGVLNSTPSWAIAPGQPVTYSTPPASDAQLAAFASQVASRYAGKISAYEVWNEPNSYYGYYPTPDAAGYTRMLQAVYPAIKAADPNATVVGGVLISVTDYGNLTVNPINYLNQMYAAGAKGSFDALSFHPYQYTLPFSQGAPYGTAAPIVQLEQMHQIMVANGDGNKLIWSTEYGTPTSVVSENTQAAMIQDYLSTWSQFSYTGPSFIYTTKDVNSSSTNDYDTLGVLRDDWSWKPAAYVIQQWTATHPQQPMPGALMAAMQTLAPNAPVAVDAASGALMTIDSVTGQPMPVTTLATAATTAAAIKPLAPADPMTAVGQALHAMATTAASDVQSAIAGMASDVTQALKAASQPAPSPTAPHVASATPASTSPSSAVAVHVPSPNPTTPVGPSGKSARSSDPSASNGTSPSQVGQSSRTGEQAAGPRQRSEQAPNASTNTQPEHAAQSAGSKG